MDTGYDLLLAKGRISQGMGTGRTLALARAGRAPALSPRKRTQNGSLSDRRPQAM